MNNKELKIEIPEGYIIDKDKSTFEKIVFKKIEELPKTWEELETISGFFINRDCTIDETPLCDTMEENRNVFPKKKYAKAVIALAQLLQLRKVYNGDWEPNWYNNDTKYCLEVHRDLVIASYYSHTNRVLSFKTEKLRNDFFYAHKDLLEIAKPLL